MKGVILAGGFGTRLFPLTHITNKHLLPVYDQPMIVHPFSTLTSSGIEDILIISNHAYINKFKNFFKKTDLQDEANLSFAAQKGAGGIAEALKLAHDFADGDNIATILGDNIFENNFTDDIKSFTKGARIFLSKVPDPQRFGIAVIENNNVVGIEEKPRQPISNYAITGFYIFDNKIFDIIKQLYPSRRGELEITDAIKVYANNQELTHSLIDGFWKDAGTFESLLETGQWVRKRSENNT